MRHLVVLGVAALALSATPVSVHAEPARQSCRILVDGEGDAEGSAGLGVVRMKSTDIVSADIASTEEYLTATVRVADLYARSSEAQMVGYSLEFTVNRSRFAFQAAESTTRIEYTVWRKTGPGNGAGDWGFVSYASGAFNDDDSAVYVTLPLARMAIRGDASYTAKDLRALSVYGYDAAVTATTAHADEAFGQGGYRLGSPSCAPAPVEPCRDPQPAGIPAQDMCPGGH